MRRRVSAAGNVSVADRLAPISDAAKVLVFIISATRSSSELSAQAATLENYHVGPVAVLSN